MPWAVVMSIQELGFPFMWMLQGIGLAGLWQDGNHVTMVLMSPTIPQLMIMLHGGVNMTLNVASVNSSQVLNLALACSEGPGESTLVLQYYSHLDAEEMRRITAVGKGKVTFDTALER